jgi:hypothetical protein
MQKELDALPTSVQIQILGVNETGHESGNASVTTGRTLPWLQDTASENVWASWQVTWRDVIVLDAQNHFVAVFNLTTHDLSKPADYAALKTLLIDTANAQ